MDRISRFLSVTAINNAHLLNISALCIVVWGLVWQGLRLYRPVWFQQLRGEPVKRRFLVGLLAGLFFKFITIPSCALAAWATPPQDDIAGIHPSMNTYQQTCWGLRGAVTFLELLHFLHHSELVLHHTLLLVVMAVIAIYNGPHRPFDLALGALVSEIPNSWWMLLRGFDMLDAHPVLGRTLSIVIAVTSVLFRIPSVFIAIAMTPTSGLRGSPAVVSIMALLFYLVYVVNIIWRKLQKSKVLQVEKDGRFSLCVHRRLELSSSTVFAGAVTLCAQVIAICLYSFLKTKPTVATASELQDIMRDSVLALFPGLVVAHWTVSQIPRVYNSQWALGVRLFSGTATATACLESSLSNNKEVHFELLVSCAFLGAFVTTVVCLLVRNFKVSSLSLLGRWVVLGWVLIIVFYSIRGDMPSANNKNRSPAEIILNQPVICELALTWQFWTCCAASVLLSLVSVHILQPQGPRSILSKKV